MAEQIRKLTHDNQKFDAQWNDIQNDLREQCAESKIPPTIDALAQYVLQEPRTSAPCDSKFDLIDRVFNAMNYDSDDDKNNSVLNHVTDVFLRVFDQGQIDRWYLAFLKGLYRHFALNDYQLKKISFLDQLFLILQKKSFQSTPNNGSIIDPWRDFFYHEVFNQNLLDESMLPTMRGKFQQLCRFALRNSSSSVFWSDIAAHFMRRLPQLFESYVNPSDIRLDLELCPIAENDDYIKLIAKNFSNQTNLFKANYTQLLKAIESLLVKNRFSDAEILMDDVLAKHFSSIPDLQPLIQIFLSSIPKISNEKKKEFAKRILSTLCDQLSRVKANKNLAPLFFDLMMTILEMRTIEAAKYAKELLEKENFYSWKDLGERLKTLIQLCGSYDGLTIDDDANTSDLSGLADILDILHELVQGNHDLFRFTHAPALVCILRWTSPPKSKPQWADYVYRMGKYMIHLIDSKQITLETYSQLLQKIHTRLQTKRDDDDDDDDIQSQLFFFIDLSRSLGTIMNSLGQAPSPAIHNTLNSMFVTIFNQPWTDEHGSASFSQEIFSAFWPSCFEMLANENDARIYLPSVAKLYTLSRDKRKQETDFYQYWSSFWSTVAKRFPPIAEDQVETLLDEFLNHHQMEFFETLRNVYPKKPKPFHTRLDKLIQISFQSWENKQNQYIYLLLLTTITKHHPEIFSSQHIDLIFTSFPKRTSELSDSDLHLIFQFLTPVAVAQPNLFQKHHPKMLEIAANSQNLSVFNCLRQNFVASTITNGEKVADDHLRKLISLLENRNGCSPDNQSSVVYACQEIGTRHRKVLEARRADFVRLNCQPIVHFIDTNKTTEENKQGLQKSRQEIEKIDRRVESTEKGVQQVRTTVQRQEKNVTTMRTHINTMDTRLQNVNERVENQQKQIELIDAKTLSYVPVWGKDVCKLLNERASNDWRLLGRRFGYSPSELRHWATQFDPCMALLNEWYMTHKADEATFGLLKMLKEIGRQDAEKIIRQAVKESDEKIPDNIDDFDIHRLPPIFISYQWNSQAMVSRLKDRLDEAGYSCWMDVGQTGGGTKRQSKIDKGIRGAKVILCCMNNDYPKLEECIGQVNLAINIGKPLIPLQMEKQTWPPEGALGPLMSDYLFIRFFDRKATNDPNFWPDERFTELLGQIRYHVAPDPDMISDRYKNWYEPKVDNLIFLKPHGNPSTKTGDAALVNIPLAVTHPQIMISYQWDRQPDIIQLYKQLTELGYRIWLDIFQMGGGDSLFAKIDDGIRNAQCIIACVTPKYTLSVNCRREMSLADALGKPIIPLLLEPLKENWPPAGPMSMVFTGKTNIDSRSHQKNDLWHDQEYDQILQKLRQHIPDVQPKNRNQNVITVDRSSSTSGNQAAAVSTSTSSNGRVGNSPTTAQSQACSIL